MNRVIRLLGGQRRHRVTTRRTWSESRSADEIAADPDGFRIIQSAVYCGNNFLYSLTRTQTIPLGNWMSYRASSRIMSAHFSPIIMVVRHGLTATRNGIAEPSATRSASIPFTRSRASSGAR